MTPSKFAGNIDLFIVDLDTNKEGMLEFIQTIRKNSLHQNTPLAVLSGDSDLQTLKRAVALGCSDFILKPFSDETLILKVYNLLGKENQIKALTFPLKPLSEKDGNPPDPGLSWNQGFEIGVEEIDNEHREIIECFAMLLSSMREGT